MSPGEFESALKAQPFFPVRVHTSSGGTHEICHPEDAIIGDEFVAIGVYEKQSERPRIQLLSLININEIEPVTSTAA